MYLVNSIIEQTIPSTVESRAAVRELLKKHRLLEIIEVSLRAARVIRNAISE